MRKTRTVSPAYFKRPRLSIRSPPNWSALRHGSINTPNCST